MSDLISRSKVIDILEKEKSLRCGYDADIAIFSIEKRIRELPSSYDVDKVVGKQGGVSDDVCEWKYSSLTGNWDSDRHKKVIKDAIACEWKFCPYCGKKIKAVE